MDNRLVRMHLNVEMTSVHRPFEFPFPGSPIPTFLVVWQIWVMADVVYQAERWVAIYQGSGFRVQGPGCGARAIIR